MLSHCTKIFLALILVIATSQTLEAQGPPPSSNLPVLTGPQKRILLMIARESIDATLEGRLPRQATVEPRLNLNQPLVISIRVDGQLKARAWRLRNPGPLYLEARDLTLEAIQAPKISDQVISLEDLARAKLDLAVLSEFQTAKDDRDIPSQSAVIIYNGFIEWLALPGDTASSSPADLLTLACEQAGLRPKAWLLPQTTIFHSKAEIAREGPGL